MRPGSTLEALLRRGLIGLVRLLVGARADWQGCRPATTSRVYFANHGSHVDTVAVMAALPWPVRRLTHPVAARDYWGSSPLRRWIAERGLRAVLINRKPRHHEPPLAPVEALLAQGRSVLIYPEGTRGLDGEVGAFHSGLFHLARRFPAAELVPVHLDNLQRILPKGSWLVVPITCTARFGAPLALGPGEGRAEFLARARQAVLALAR